MALYCSEEIFEALSGLRFPADKEAVIGHATKKKARRTVLETLRQLEEGVQFGDVGAVCKNVKVVCSLEVYKALNGLRFPAAKDRILTHAAGRGASLATFTALENLPEGYSFNSIGEICERVL